MWVSQSYGLHRINIELMSGGQTAPEFTWRSKMSPGSKMSQVTLTFIVRESRSKSAVNIRVTMNTGQMKYHKAWYAYVPIGSLYPILLFVWVRLDFDLVKRQIAHYSFEIDRVKMSQQTIDCQRLLRRSCTHCQYCNGQCSEPSCDYAINGTQYNRCAWAIAFDHNEEF